MHLLKHQELLRKAAQHGYLDQATEQIRQENPDAFHIEKGENETLSRREFHHPPIENRHIPHKVCHSTRFSKEAVEQMREEAIALAPRTAPRTTVASPCA